MRHDEPSDNEAFEQLRSEVSLLRRAIEGLSAATAEVAAPDYSPTLAGLRKAIDGVGERLDALVADPPVTSNQLAAAIAAVAAHARNDGRREVGQAKSALEAGVRDLAQAAGAVRAVRTTRRRLVAVGLGGVAVGMGLWVGLAGLIARGLPRAWHVPEQMAAATLGQPRWEAGSRLLQSADPGLWKVEAAGARLWRDNRPALEACLKAAEKAQKPETCKVVVSGRSGPKP